MAAVKETNGNSMVVPSQGVEAIATKKSLEMEVGRVLLTVAVRQTEDTKEELKKEQIEKAQEPKEERHDVPELSRQSKWFGLESKLLKDGSVKWILEMEQELWETLLNWEPSQGKDISKQLEELSKLYLALLEAILTHTIGEEQAIQIDRLNEVLAGKLNQLSEIKLKELLTLLERSGQRDTLKIVKSSLYKRVTGETISPKAAEQFFARGSSLISHREVRSSGQQINSTLEEGRLYKLAKGGDIQVNQDFEAYKKSGEAQMSQRNRVLNDQREESAESNFFSREKSLVSGKEMTVANDFARHLNGKGDLFHNQSLTSSNNEVTGLLAAITSIKGQVYMSDYSKENTIKVPMKTAVDQMVDYYLTKREAYDVYYYTINVYGRTRNPQKSIEEGLEYAYRRFLEKKEEAGDKKQGAYSEKAGFFQTPIGGKTLEEDFKRGIRLLEENWREFLKAMGEKGKLGFSLTAQKYSPWGFLIEPEDLKKSPKEKKDKITRLQIMGLIILGIGYLCYRLFF